MIIFLIQSLLFIALAQAEDIKPQSPIDFSQDVLNPMGQPFISCEDKAHHCQNDTLRWIAYAALSAPSTQRQPGTGPTIRDHQDAVLADKIGRDKDPVDLTVDERSWLKEALFRVYAPGLAYAACLLIVPRNECDK